MKSRALLLFGIVLFLPGASPGSCNADDPPPPVIVTDGGGPDGALPGLDSGKDGAPVGDGGNTCVKPSQFWYGIGKDNAHLYHVGKGDNDWAEDMGQITKNGQPMAGGVTTLAGGGANELFLAGQNSILRLDTLTRVLTDYLAIASMPTFTALVVNGTGFLGAASNGIYCIDATGVVTALAPVTGALKITGIAGSCSGNTYSIQGVYAAYVTGGTTFFNANANGNTVNVPFTSAAGQFTGVPGGLVESGTTTTNENGDIVKLVATVPTKIRRVKLCANEAGSLFNNTIVSLTALAD